MTQLVLYIPNLGKFVGQNDNLVDDISEAVIFDSILSADCHSMYLESVLGVRCFTQLRNSYVRH